MPGSAPSRNAARLAGVGVARGGRAPTRSPRRPRARRRAPARRRARQGASFQVPVSIGQARVRTPSDGARKVRWQLVEFALRAEDARRARRRRRARLRRRARVRARRARSRPASRSPARASAASAPSPRAPRIDAAFARPIDDRLPTARRLVVDPAQLGAERERRRGGRARRSPRRRAAASRCPSRYSQRTAARRSSTALAAARSTAQPVDATVIGATATGPDVHAGEGRARRRRDDDARRDRAAAARRDARAAAAAHDDRGRSRSARSRELRPGDRHRPRGANTLRLYDGRKLVRTFRVATGQAIYPTPAGRLADHEQAARTRGGTRRPTTPGRKGLKPVPPGPSNPLGTRWMGLTAPGVGIHGTDAADARSATAPRTAASGCTCPRRSGSSSTSRVGTPVVIL